MQEQEQQTIASHFGITVFGSATVGVVPDTAVLTCSVSLTSANPRKAFEASREAARKLRNFLDTQQPIEIKSSQIMLNEVATYNRSQRKVVEYQTFAEFRISFSGLDRIEKIMTGVVEAGATTIKSVHYQSSQMKQIRTEARKQAVEAAREKAEAYCTAAGIELGNVLQIDDMTFTPTRSHFPAIFAEEEQPSYASAPVTKIIEPSEITVSEYVRVLYKIK